MIIKTVFRTSSPVAGSVIFSSMSANFINTFPKNILTINICKFEIDFGDTFGDSPEQSFKGRFLASIDDAGGAVEL